MGLKEKGTIIEFTHSVSPKLDMVQKTNPQKLVDVKISLMCDSLYYTDEKHKEMIDELREVIRKYV
jgi:hypothetical protein